MFGAKLLHYLLYNQLILNLNYQNSLIGSDRTQKHMPISLAAFEIETIVLTAVV